LDQSVSKKNKIENRGQQVPLFSTSYEDEEDSKSRGERKNNTSL